MADASDTKQSVYYDTDQQPGLEVADSTNKLKGFYGPGAPDGIEVVPHQGLGGKEVVPGSSPPLERRSSLNQPEVWHDPHQQQQQPFIEQEKQSSGEVRDYDGDKEVAPSKWTRRRYCGMRGKWLAILLAAILLVVILAAVLGGVLGSVLGSDSSSNSSSGSSRGINGGIGTGSSGNSSGASSQAVTGSRKAQSQSGIAATFLGSNNNTLLTYYQDDSNRIIENVYIDGAWKSDTSSAAAIVANASAGSPLAAISYNYDGSTWRQVFFAADDTSLWTTKATADGAWEEPFKLKINLTGSSTNLSSTHLAQGPALAACYAGDVAGGTRLYYGEAAGYIQELGTLNEDQSVWYAFNQFPQSDASSGVGCDFYSDPSDDGELGAIINVYYRNTTSLELQQSWWSYITNGGWNSGPFADGISIGSGTAITVTADEAKEEYVFFQSSNGTVTRGAIDATLSAFGTFNDLGDAISGGRLASAYYDGGTVYMFQNSTEDTTIWLSNWNLTGDLATSQQLPGTGVA